MRSATLAKTLAHVLYKAHEVKEPQQFPRASRVGDRAKFSTSLRKAGRYATWVLLSIYRAADPEDILTVHSCA